MTTRKIPFTLRRAGIRASLALGLTLAIGGMGAQAQSGNFPNRTIKIIVPYSAGSGSDTLARTIGQAIAEKSRQSVVIENHEGGGGLIGTMVAGKAAPDGYTILIAANPFVIGPVNRATPSYDPLKDFVPVVKFGIIPLMLAAATSAPFNNIREMVAYAKANPGKLSYASSGPGSSSQQEMELFKQAAGISIEEIPYKSTAQAMTDLLGGQVPLFPVVVPLVQPHLKTGKAKGLAVFDTRRSAQFPEIAPIAEQLGVPGYTATPVWYGFVAPAGTPPEAIAALNALVLGAMQTQEVKERLVTAGATPVNVTNEQFLADMRTEFLGATQLARQRAAGK